jgi:hypothetical protein
MKKPLKSVRIHFLGYVQGEPIGEREAATLSKKNSTGKLIGRNAFRRPNGNP